MAGVKQQQLLSVRSSWLSSTKPHPSFSICPFLDTAEWSLLCPRNHSTVSLWWGCQRPTGGWWDGFLGGAQERLRQGWRGSLKQEGRKMGDWFRTRYVSRYSSILKDMDETSYRTFILPEADLWGLIRSLVLRHSFVLQQLPFLFSIYSVWFWL